MRGRLGSAWATGLAWAMTARSGSRTCRSSTPTSQGFQGAGCGGCQFLNVDIVGVATDPQTGANLCRAFLQ